jgi:hypothetical protein
VSRITLSTVSAPSTPGEHARATTALDRTSWEFQRAVGSTVPYFQLLSRYLPKRGKSWVGWGDALSATIELQHARSTTYILTLLAGVQKRAGTYILQYEYSTYARSVDVELGFQQLFLWLPCQPACVGSLAVASFVPGRISPAGARPFHARIDWTLLCIAYGTSRVRGTVRRDSRENEMWASRQRQPREGMRAGSWRQRDWLRGPAVREIRK